MNCDHDFIRLNESEVFYVIVVCAYCGQVRHIFGDGRVDIVKEAGQIKREHS